MDHHGWIDGWIDHHHRWMDERIIIMWVCGSSSWMGHHHGLVDGWIIDGWMDGLKDIMSGHGWVYEWGQWMRLVY